MPKKNLRTIPAHIRRRLHAFSEDDVVVACVKRLSGDEVLRYAHLGLRYSPPDVNTPPPTVPSPKAGRYSRINVHGEEVVRRDLPKYTKTYYIDSPNFGDPSRGWHTVAWDRLVYHRDFIPPKELELAVDLVDRPAPDVFNIKFEIKQVLSKASSDFDDDLLYNLNLLQENVGAVDVFRSAATLAEFTRTVQLDWEILPPGDLQAVVRRLLEKKRDVSADERKTIEERLAVFSKFSPTAYLAGTSGFLRYFGAQFRDDLVVFENVNYGNALYVMTDNWQELSKRSRVDLLKGPREGFERIEHRQGWETQLQGVLQKLGVAPTNLFNRRRRRR
jgi:hypothetical protein